MASLGKRSRKPRAKKCFVDRLSNLPDDVLHRILSFLDFLDVVRTCVLSRRWKTVWMSVSCLNFSKDWFFEHNSGALQETLDPRYKFWDFIKWALLLRDECTIHKISLSSDDTIMDQLNGLLRVAGKRKVQELCFREGDHAAKDLEFPRAICETLTSLTLDFRDDIPLRAATTFRNLRNLYLRGVVISRDTADKFLSRDSIFLESVHLEGCQFSGIERINISANNLKNLTIANMYCFGNIWIVGLSNFNLKICSASLVSFSYIGPMLSSFDFSNSVSLRHVLIRIIRVPRRYGDQSGNKNLSSSPTRFAGLDHAKVLTTSSLVVKHLSPTFGNFYAGNFILDNLNCLKLGLRYNVDCIEGLINFLRLAPNLETLVIRFREVSWHSGVQRNTKRASEARGTWKSRIEDIACLSYHLKSVEISNFDGSDIAVGLVRFLLQNGKVLENVEIMCRSKERKQKVFSKLVAALPLASPNVVISFPAYAQKVFPWFHRGDSDPEDD